MGREGVVGRRTSVPVPRTDLLADVAAEHPVVERGAHRDGNGGAMLDGEVGETAGRGHGVIVERARGAGGEAGRGPAAVDAQHGGWGAGWDGEQRSKKARTAR